MPGKPNKKLRLAVPLVLLLGAIGVAIAVGVNTSRQGSGSTADGFIPQNTPGDTATDTAADTSGETPPEGTADTPATAALTSEPEPQPDPQADPTSETQLAQSEPASPATDPAGEQPTPVATPTTSTASAADTTALASLSARVLSDPAAPLTPLGNLDEASDFEGALTFSARGAGLASLKLTHYFKTVEKLEHVELQAERFVPLANGSRRYAVPFALLGVTINDQFVPTAAPGTWLQDQTNPGRFSAIIENPFGEPIVEIVRTFEYAPDTFDLTLRQEAINLSDQDLTITWVQTGPVDLAKPASKYGGDKRRVRFGYFLNPQAQAGSPAVVADTELRARTKVLGDRDDIGAYTVESPLWPTTDAIQQGQRLVWAAFTDRYFAVAVHALFDIAAAQTNPEIKLLEGNATLDRLVLNPMARPEDTVVVTRLTSAPQSLPAAGTANADLGVYAGPLLKSIINEDPIAASLNLGGLVVYNYGGFCGELCTFAPLTIVLMATLRFFESIALDWAAAIILLVICVRAILHPITRWSQIRVRRFGAQMQNAQPKMKKVQELYKPLDSDSPEEKKRKQQKIQQEMARLWKEEGINPANALGCLPMLLQSPVWIALWASLYFAAELRHEPAFWGVFQTISAGNWDFLADLASPDKALPLGPLAFTPPLIGNIFGRIESINLLPILMGIVFYIQQKYLTPPTSATLSPDQEQMQKTMRVMFPLMMPIFMYTAPAGLTVYFITNSTLGILEYKWIYHEATKKGLLDPEAIKAEKTKKNTSGKPGFFERLKTMAEEQQKLRAQGQPGAGKKYVQNTSAPKKDLPKRYKKRG